MHTRGRPSRGCDSRSQSRRRRQKAAHFITWVCDGPFAETKEQIGGYDVLECADLDAAVGAAAAHPLARTAKVEVRPFWDAPWQH